MNKAFQKSKFSKTFFNKSWSPGQIFFKEKKLERFDQFLTQKNDFESQNFEMLKKVVHNINFIMSDDDMI